jgi:hypothetical protein
VLVVLVGLGVSISYSGGTTSDVGVRDDVVLFGKDVLSEEIGFL